MKKLIIGSLVLLSSCSMTRSCNSMKRTTTGNMNYYIYVYSGGKIIFKDNFYGIINNSAHSDGIYYYKNDTLIEISGDYILKAE